MLRITDMEFGNADRTTLTTISHSLSAQYSRTIVQRGDVVISVVGTIGKAFQVDASLAGVNLSRAVARLQLDAGITAEFACWIFQSLQFKRFVDLVCVGTAQRVLNMADLTAFRTVNPPVSEQSQIAAFLDRETAKIDKLVAEQRRLMDMLKEKRQAVVSHAVTKGLNPNAPMKSSGIDWLGNVPEHWEIMRLKYVTPQITVGIVVEPSKYYVAEGIPALRSLNVAPGSITMENLVFISKDGNELHAKSKLRAGDLVAVRSGQPGTTAVIPPELDGCNCIDLIIVRKPTIGSERFLCWYMASDVAVMQFSIGSGGAIQQHFNIGTAKDLVVPVPPAKEQSQIADCIDRVATDFDILIAEAQRSHRPAAGTPNRADLRGRHRPDRRPRARRGRGRMSLHKEISFETEICEHLAAHGWLYAEGDAAGYDRARALFPADVLAWVQATQPKAWETLTKNHGAQAGETLLARLRDQLDQRGTLDVLRHGIELLGLKQPLKLAEFKPALAINADILARYAANRLRVVRQVRYSLHNENCIDLVLFLNGVPVATVELKTDFTQSIGDAIDQYRFDRLPRPKGQAAEPLLSFPNGALVHFAVSNSEVHMVTKLDGPATVFLPFNQGDDGAAGNPVNPTGGHRTAYLWEQVWARESWLEILGRYLIAQRDKKKQIEQVIFPRFHQLDVTRKLQAAVLGGRAGRQVSRPALGGLGQDELHRVDGALSRRAARRAAQEGLRHRAGGLGSQRHRLAASGGALRLPAQSGVVATIKGNDGSKSGELAEALSGDKKIVVCTIQTFPFALEAVRKLAATQGKRFAVIADEAHSSQTGEAAAKLKAVLSPEELAELDDGGEVSTEDILAAQMAARADDARHHVRGLHGDAEEQDDGALRHASRSVAQAGGRTTAGAVPRLFDAAGHRGEVHPRRAAELHALQAGLQAGARGQGATTRRTVERSAAHEGDHGLGAAAPLQHRAEGADRGRALPRIRGAAARRQGEGDGGGRRAAWRPCAGSWRSRNTSRSAATRSARWWRSPAR